MAKIRSSSSYLTTSLEEGWEVAQADPDRVTTPAELDRAAPFFPAVVPGTAAEALRRAGTWDFDRPRDFDSSDWWYRVRFARDTAEGAREARDASTYLRLDGLASVADVWLNGAKIAETDNMFRAYELDVTAALRDANELAIRFRSLGALIKARKGRPRWKTRLVDQQQLRWYRTTLLGRIPGWTPPVAPVGPWRPVQLEQRRHVSLDRANVRAIREGNGGKVVARFTGRTLGKDPITAAHLSVGAARFPLTPSRTSDGGSASSASAGFTIDAEVRLEQVDAWWPHTHGAQPLYPVVLTLRIGDVHVAFDCGRVGFRTVHLVTDDGAFELRVNGEPIFCRGACWTTTDVVTLDGTGRGASAALDTARSAGMNMVRIGGTMVYEADCFYDACDERGILVWQDFMFANMDYPGEDEGFRANVVAEANHVMSALETRPSLAIACGNSEIEQQVAM
ncbi:MAG: glycoside hydrolase family 2 protein, partial [Polyangiaceae bacterium]